jgi:hypothetical protein
VSESNVALARELLAGMARPDLLDLVRRLGAGDTEALGEFAPLLERLDPDVIWDVSAVEIPDLDVLHGRAGVIDFWVRWLAEWADYSIEAGEFEGRGDQVVYDVTIRGRSRLAGVPAELHMWQLAEFRDGRLVSFRGLRTHEEALEAAGWTTP